MIPAQHHYEATYRHEEDGRTWYSSRPVIGWNEDGEPLVVEDSHGHLVRAAYAGKLEHVEKSHGPVVGTLPPGGWQVVYEEGDKPRVDPLLGWLVRADGTVEPADMSVDAVSLNPTRASNFIRLLSPDEEAPTELD
ncbi:hypothetical protein ACFTXJ_14515 [Streptomyces zhihengii]|uniref:hypothetical protein n=1 Tax=Streptomyces zhihengii TaxID=1818004 RepID=UPI00362E8C54